MVADDQIKVTKKPKKKNKFGRSQTVMVKLPNEDHQHNNKSIVPDFGDLHIQETDSDRKSKHRDGVLQMIGIQK